MSTLAHRCDFAQTPCGKAQGGGPSRSDVEGGIDIAVPLAIIRKRGRGVNSAVWRAAGLLPSSVLYRPKLDRESSGPAPVF
jgi:hypothetical protein